MRDPLNYFKDEIEEIITTTNQETLSSLNLTQEEIVERNNFIMDLIIKQ